MGTRVDGEKQDDLKDEKHDGVDDWDLDPKELLNTIG